MVYTLLLDIVPCGTVCTGAFDLPLRLKHPLIVLDRALHLVSWSSMMRRSNVELSSLRPVRRYGTVQALQYTVLVQGSAAM